MSSEKGLELDVLVQIVNSEEKRIYRSATRLRQLHASIKGLSLRFRNSL